MLPGDFPGKLRPIWAAEISQGEKTVKVSTFALTNPQKTGIIARSSVMSSIGHCGFLSPQMIGTIVVALSSQPGSMQSRIFKGSPLRRFAAESRSG